MPKENCVACGNPNQDKCQKCESLEDHYARNGNYCHECSGEAQDNVFIFQRDMPIIRSSK